MAARNRRSRSAFVLGTLLLLLSAAACSSGSDGDHDPTIATDRPSGHPESVEKLLVIVVENHSLDQMRAQMPRLSSLAERFGFAVDYHAVAHPSLPNYLAMTSGSTHGITDDAPPAVNGFRGPSVFGLALQAGHTARLYSEGTPANCALEDGGQLYAVRHNPWAYHVDERVACAQHSVGLKQLDADVASGELPTIGMIVPNTCNDAHDCDLGRADDWIQRVVSHIRSGPDWESGRLALVVTADEDDHNQRNHVLTVVVHPALRHKVVERDLDHYSLARSLFDVAGVSPLGEASEAPSLLEEFGLR